jgi:hypothetical protein
MWSKIGSKRPWQCCQVKIKKSKLTVKYRKCTKKFKPKQIENNKIKELKILNSWMFFKINNISVVLMCKLQKWHKEWGSYQKVVKFGLKLLFSEIVFKRTAQN